MSVEQFVPQPAAHPATPAPSPQSQPSSLEPQQPAPNNARAVSSVLLRRRFFARGESAVASIGIAAAAILLAAMAALAAWTMRWQREQLVVTRAQRTHEIGTLLVQSLEAMLAQNDVTPARRLVADAARADGMSFCRVVLPDGKVIADAEPSRINAQHLPTVWPKATDAASRAQADTSAAGAAASDTMITTFALQIPGHGEATLQLGAPQPQLHNLAWEAQAGIGGIGAVALITMLLAYRRMRSKMAAIGAIREALLSAAAGEDECAALCVSPALGVEATPWNSILTERDELRRHVRNEQARQSHGSRRSAKHDLDIAFDTMPQGLILVDETLRIRWSNGAAAVFLKAKREEMGGADIARFIAQDEIISNLKSISDGSMRRKTSIEVEQKNGGAATILRFSIRPVRREDSAAAMIMIEDITQQRVAAESRNNFVAQATHELRTPLTNIRLYVETAIDDGAKDPALRGNCLNVINQEARRLERIVGEMLSVAEIEAGALKLRRDDVRLDQLFTDLKADFQQQAEEKRIKLTFDLPPKMPVLQADRDKVMVAVHNLIGNALKYTPEGGDVKVAMEVAKDQVVINVTDTGFGISEEDAAKIFDRFYRANDPRVEKITGTGLGLTLAREVVRLHGGDITVESQLNKGSTFTISLPVTAAQAAA